MSKRHVVQSVADAGLYNAVEGDVNSEIGVFCLMEIPSDPIKLAYMVREANAVGPDITSEDLSRYSGWGILQEQSGGRALWHMYDSDEEALEAFTAMSETYFVERGL